MLIAKETARALGMGTDIRTPEGLPSMTEDGRMPKNLGRDYAHVILPADGFAQACAPGSAGTRKQSSAVLITAPGIPAAAAASGLKEHVGCISYRGGACGALQGLVCGCPARRHHLPLAAVQQPSQWGCELPYGHDCRGVSHGGMRPWSPCKT